MHTLKGETSEKVQQLLGRLAAARRNTDELFDRVKPDARYERPVAERHRLIFYLGHLEAFDWNLFRGRIPGLKAFAPEFDRLFAFGIDPVGGGLPTDDAADWPTEATIRRYNQRVRATLDAALAPASVHWFGEEAPELLLNVAIEHRLMHAETLAYLLNRLPPDQKLRPAYRPSVLAEEVVPGEVEIPAGSATLGRARNASDEDFGWDNEYEEHTVEVPAFAIDRYPLTNGQYLEFVNSGGYHDRAFWSANDWRWRREHGIDHPAFWIPGSAGWHYRGMFDHLPLPLQWPVYVSHAEASAYARWIGKALPSEAQWQRAAYGTHHGHERAYPWGNAPLPNGIGNCNFRGWDPVPVGAFPQNRSAFGVMGLLGNGWEWTPTPFAPFEGFRPFACYPGYSANFFDDRHYVLKGGSARTAACLLRRSFRNWFQPHYPYVYAGFRCVSQ